MIKIIKYSVFCICCFILSCITPNRDTQFTCYVEAINLLYSTKFVDTVYVSLNFPNFKVNNGKFPEEIFTLADLSGNIDEYHEIVPSYHFWQNHLLDNVESVINKQNNKKVQFSRFNYSFNMKLENIISYDRIFLTFSPIYYNPKVNKGFFIVSEINNYKIGSTKVFYLSKNNDNIFKIKDQLSVHRFMPY